MADTIPTEFTVPLREYCRLAGDNERLAKDRQTLLIESKGLRDEIERLREQIKYVVAHLDPLVGTGNEPVEYLVRMAVKRIRNG